MEQEDCLQLGSKQANLIYPLLPCSNAATRETGCIYLGGKAAAMDKQFLREKGIKAILTVAQGIDICAENEIAHVQIDAYDNTTYNIRDDFEGAFEFIDSHIHSTNVLIHCEQGVSRSPTIAIAYIMRKEKRMLHDVLFSVKQKRQEVSPNGAFIFYLEKYCQHLQEIYKEEYDINNENKFIRISSSPPIFFSSRPKQQMQLVQQIQQQKLEQQQKEHQSIHQFEQSLQQTIPNSY